MKYRAGQYNPSRRIWKRLFVVCLAIGALGWGVGIYGWYQNRPSIASTPVIESKAESKPEQPKARIVNKTEKYDINLLLVETNRHRVAAGLSPVQLYEPLNRSAVLKCDDMVALNYWAHNRPNGESPWVFFKRAGISYSYAGENLAYGSVNETDLVQGWMDSPTHRENMLNPAFTLVGFGSCGSTNFNDQGWQSIAVQHLIKP